METNNIPYFAHEGMMARMERTIRRLWILALVLVVLLVASNAAWLWYESQFEIVETSQEIYQDIDAGDGGRAVILDGIHIDGTSTTGD